MVQVLGFIRLGRIPNARNGTDSTPRSGTGRCSCCQHPMQILAWCAVMRRHSRARIFAALREEANALVLRLSIRRRPIVKVNKALTRLDGLPAFGPPTRI